MWRRLWITLATGTALTGAYLGYSALLTPTIRVHQRLSQQPPVEQAAATPRPTENLRIAETWMKHRPWTAAAKKILWTKEMYIFADEWTPRSEQGQVRFRPFAGVWITKNKQGEEEAMTVTADSALLQFESKFDLDHPQPGRVTGGRLDGEVQIDGPDGLKITGENFIFSEGASSIQSPKGNSQPVMFAFGENKGTAGWMLIRLIKGNQPASKDRPNIVGVESVELSQNPKMVLKLDDDPKSQPITVKCTDTFKYHVESQTAVFDKNVLAYRRMEDSKSYDRLRCDRLTVQFEPKPVAANDAAPAAAAKTNDEYQRIERNLQFKSLKAEGSSVLVASGQDLGAMMTLLTYDAASRTIQMSSPKAVVVKQRRNHLECPNIRLVLGAGNSLEEAVCEGAGWLEAFNEKTGEIAFYADWMKQLRKSTDPETQLDLVELQQDASFRQPSQDSGMVADVIRLWFTPLEQGTANQQLFNFGGGSGSPDPKRLLAQKRVALVSPKLEADTDHLEVLFDEETDSARPKEPPLSRRPRRQLNLASARNGRVRSVAFASVAPEIPTDSELQEDEDELPQPPMTVVADKIRVRMLKPASVDATPEVREIWTMGRVQVEQPSSTGDGSLQITGSKMHIENHSETDQIAHVYGEPNRPALIRDEQQQLHIEGELIHFDRSENLAWVEGAGLLQMPVKESLDGQQLEQPQLLDVWWRERMDFDGLLATFDGDVRVKLAEVRMECQSMEVALASKVQFTAAKTSGEPPKLASIVCRDNVKFENRRLVDNRLMDIQIARAFEFQLDYATKIAKAKGPGWMQMWQRRKSTRAGLAAQNTVKANSTSNEPSTEWEYSRVDFFGRMDGQIADRRMTLLDRVKVLHGPVLKPMDEFDQYHIPEGGATMTCKELQVLQTLDDEQGQSFIKLLGAGDAKLEGRGYYGRADQISYDETKGLFILHSIGSGKATIWQQTKNGEKLPAVNAQQIHFVPETGRTRVINATGGEGSS